MADCGAIPCFVSLLASPHVNVCEQVVWALGNISGDGPELRNRVIECGAVGPMLELLNRTDAGVPFLRNVTWSVSNLCRNKNPDPPKEVIIQCLPVIIRMAQHPDKDIQGESGCQLAIPAEELTD